MSDDEIMIEPRQLLFEEVLSNLKTSLDNMVIDGEKRGIQYMREAWIHYRDDDKFRVELFEGAINDVFKGLPTESNMQPEQIAIELGYYIRKMSPLRRMSQYHQYNAVIHGTIEGWLSDAIICILSDVVHGGVVCISDSSPREVFEHLFKESEMPSLRSIICIGEQTISPMFDYKDIIRQAKEIVADAVENDDEVVSANWYWEGVAKEIFDSQAQSGCEPFDDSDGVSKTTAQEYNDEWFWDIISSQYAWGPLDWQRFGEWCALDKTLHEIISSEIIRQMAIDMKADYFPCEDAIMDWQGENV